MALILWYALVVTNTHVKEEPTTVHAEDATHYTIFKNRLFVIGES